MQNYKNLTYNIQYEIMCKKSFLIPIGDYGRKTFWWLAAKNLPDVDDIARRIKMFLFIIKGEGVCGWGGVGGEVLPRPV